MYFNSANENHDIVLRRELNLRQNQVPFEYFKCNRVAFKGIGPTFVLTKNISYEFL